MSSIDLEKLNHFYGEDGTLVIGSYLDLSNQELTELPGWLNGAIIHGFFQVDNNPLTSLKNFPSEIKGVFYCRNTLITNFENIKGCNIRSGLNFYHTNGEIPSYEGPSNGKEFDEYLNDVSLLHKLKFITEL